MYKIHQIKLLAVRDGHVTATKKNITTPEDIAYIIKPLLCEADREHCLVIMLNGKNQREERGTLPILIIWEVSL